MVWDTWKTKQPVPGAGAKCTPLSSTPLDVLFSDLASSREGLTDAEAQARLARFGPNDALAHQGLPLSVRFLLRFSNPLILILLFASALSALAGDTASFLIVVVIVTLSVTLDFVQEVRAQNAVDALRRSVAPKALVLRDGRERELHFEELVPGDVVRLAAGDIVPADCRLISARDLFVNQALLTGEPYPAEKHAGDLPARSRSPTRRPISSSWAPPSSAGPRPRCVCRTGGETRIGGLASQLAPPPAARCLRDRRAQVRVPDPAPHLLPRAVRARRRTCSSIGPGSSRSCSALALAVGLTPELLPMVVTVTLARGAMRLARRGVIVKRLPAIHDLGAMDMLCTDKTGTLTEAKIRLVRHVDADGAEAPKVLRLAYLNSAFETRHPQPAGRRDPRASRSRTSGNGPSSTRCRSTSSAAASRLLLEKRDDASGC